MDGILHEATLGCERELERRQRRLERQRQLCSESEQVERWQSGRFSPLFSFFRCNGGSFVRQTLLPAAKLSTYSLKLFQ